MKVSKKALLIRGGRIFDPGQGIDLVGDLFLADGRVQWLVPSWQGREAPPDTQIFEAKNRLVCPGFIDLHCHLREPGFESKETISTGMLAAVQGGFTTVCAMPNTQPPFDNSAIVEQVQRSADSVQLARLLPIGCVTMGRAGKTLVDMTDLARSGVVAFSDDGAPVSDADLMNKALAFSKALGLPIINHCEELAISKNGAAHAGWVAAYLGISGQSSSAEESMVARDIGLAELTGGKLHLAHVSTAGSVALVRMAKERGLQVTAEATPHHLVLTEEWIMLPPKGPSRGPKAHDGTSTPPLYDTRAKVNPPLRTEEDRTALVKGVCDGTIDIIATDHAPHSQEDKECTFQEAAFGITGLETAFGLLMGLVHRGDMTMGRLIQDLTLGPARVLGPAWSQLGNLNPGSAADVTIVDPDAEWIVEPEAFASKGKNTPLGGVMLKGRIVATVVAGRLVHQEQI